MRLRLVSLVAVLAGSGCGPTNLKDLCWEAAGSLCRQLYRCQPEEARAVWPNIQDCTNELSAREGCHTEEAKACQVDPYLSSACIDAIDNIPCAGDLVFPAECDLRCK